MNGVGVMHLTDMLNVGGKERMVINLVNPRPRDRYVDYRCTTRREGPLAGLVAEDVGRLRLERSQRFDISAVYRLVTFIRSHNIQIFHALNQWFTSFLSCSGHRHCVYVALGDCYPHDDGLQVGAFRQMSRRSRSTPGKYVVRWRPVKFAALRAEHFSHPLAYLLKDTLRSAS